ncbi:hypothetical protein AMATHDRAFT_8547 [Amanita thiersii Skay4041]|uniref:CCHC-type domain-containing protein n=1 Tax=Amanita thiersii Skay4041 TaxID=703135 RepID=A0A2A9N797_9AGAR|nr:hypothetical protein AMATHDRAFT_8547 [Amanita thiersii Skay4041]
MLDDELQTMSLIRALPDEYAGFTSSLMLLEKLDKDIILQAFKGEEMNHQKQIEIASRAYTSAPNVKPKVPFDPKKAKCYFCQEIGHTVRRCPKLKDKREQGGNASHNAERAEETTESTGHASTLCYTSCDTSTNSDWSWNTDTGATSHMTPHHQ